MADTPKTPEQLAKTNIRFWIFGFFVSMLILLIGLAIPGLPYIGPIALGLVALGGGGVLGTVIVGICLAITPRLIKSVFNLKDNAKKGTEIAAGVLKAILITAVTTLASYFLMPMLLSYLASFSSLSFLSSFAGGGHSVISIIMTVVSALMTFRATLLKSPGGAHIKANWLKSGEMLVGMLLGAFTAALAFGLLPITLPVSVAVVCVITGVVAVGAMFGFFTDVITGNKKAAPNTELGTEMADMSKKPVELPAQRKADAAPAANATPAAQDKADKAPEADENARQQPGWTKPADPADSSATTNSAAPAA